MSDSELVSRRSLEALEFPQTLALVGELAATDIGRDRVLGLRPVLGERLEVRRRRQEEAGVLLAEGALVPAHEEALAPLAAELGRPRPEIDGRALLAWARLIAITSRVLGRVRSAEGLRQLPGEVEELADLDWLAKRIEAAIDDRGEVRDDASPKLNKLRGRIGRQREAAYAGLRGVLETHGELFSEDTTPLRNGRLVVMLRASDRGRLDGLVHGRSASGRSLYFEPMSVVESNNALQEAIDEEAAERRRVLGELREALQGQAESLYEHLELLARMDALQAAWRFGELCRGRLAELSGNDLALVGARHPLLDAATAELRESALGAVGHEGDATPLDLELQRDGRVLVITGPNAGGKTVALKTVGLLVALTQSGLPVPAEVGTRLPCVEALVAVVGDEQDLMRDRSTFSGRLLRLKEAWEAAGEASLILLDELGSGTDPQEGAALALALLERLAATGASAVVTTHLLELASAALELDGAACAAMEFDRKTGRPTYRLLPGPPGSSEAIALARQLELPEEWLTRASALVGPEHRTLGQMLAEVESLRGELEAERLAVDKERRLAERAREASEAERVSLIAERKQLAKRQKQELAEFRRQVRTDLQGEVDRLRDELVAGRRRGLASEAVERLFSEAPEADLEDERTRVAEAGDRVRHTDYGWEGVVDKIDGERVAVTVHGKRVQCDLASLAVVEATPETPRRRAVEVRHEDREVPSELKLIGCRVDEALEAIDAYLDRAVVAGRPQVRLVHGHGSGRLRDAVRKFLERHPSVDAFRPGRRREGGDGATVVSLRL